MSILVGCSLRKGSAFAYQQAMAAHEDAGEGKNGGYEAYEGPKSFGHDVEPSEVQIGEPGKKLIAKEAEHSGEGEVYCGDSPYCEEEEAPDAENVVQVPIDSRKTGSPIYNKAPAPMG